MTADFLVMATRTRKARTEAKWFPDQAEALDHACDRSRAGYRCVSIWQNGKVTTDHLSVRQYAVQ